MLINLVCSVMMMRAVSGSCTPTQARLVITHLAEARHAMTVHDHTPSVVYRQLDWAVGYRFGDDGSISSCRSRMGLTQDWHSIRPKQVSIRGHQQVSLYIGGTKANRYVHRLILEAFVGPCPPGMECCHADGDPTNNRLDNLRWDTRKANTADSIRHGTKPRGSKHHRSKLTDDDIRAIRRLRDGGMILRLIAERYGVTRPQIGSIISGRTWKHV